MQPSPKSSSGSGHRKAMFAVDSNILTALIGFPAAFLAAVGTVWVVNRPPRHAAGLQEYATRDDLEGIRVSLQKDINGLRDDVREDIDSVRSDVRAQFSLVVDILRRGHA